MTIQALYSGREDYWPAYQAALEKAFSTHGLDIALTRDAAPQEVDYVIYSPAGGLTDFAPFTKLKAVLSLWAGVERIIGNTSIQVPLCRMNETGLRDGMREYVCGHVLRYHLGMDRHIHGATWDGITPPLARDRTVTVLGLGALGQACADALKGLGFNVVGWSRSAKDLEGIECLHGNAGLNEALPQADILVTLLPDTPATQNLLNEETLKLLPKGARIINPGRGTLIDDDALLVALDAGHIGHATLDVFREEPLPEAHAYWAHPNVTVTPHIASVTRPETSAEKIAENIARCEAGEPLLDVVDRTRGY